VAKLDPRRLVFLDETGAKTNMIRTYARARKCERAIDFAPNGHWHVTTLIAGITCEGAIAPMVLNGAMDTLAFEAYLAQVLIPALPKDAILVMDNLPAHKPATVIRLLEEAGVQPLYLPPYSPDFNPIELMWSKVKAYLRGAKARTEEELYASIAAALNTVSPKESRAYFRHCFVGIIS
jgi:transposase